MKRYTIREIAQQTGVATSTLRYYEAIGLLPVPERSNGRRLYSEAVLQQMSVIQLAKAAGFTLPETHILLHGFSPDTPPATRWQALATTKLAEITQHLKQLEQMRLILQRGLQCQCLRLEECVIVGDECHDSQASGDACITHVSGACG